ncbi:MAG: hypothetical protein JNG90_04725 [Planctomycetaceae bacterium]|nr:hypothetical protein [Planctomycetaceae bacterium]
MSVGPTLSVLASAAGVPLAQTKGTEVDRTRREVDALEVQLRREADALSAAGVAAADDQRHSATEREQDQRPAWILSQQKPAVRPGASAARPASAYDPEELAGQELDLRG